MTPRDPAAEVSSLFSLPGLALAAAAVNTCRDVPEGVAAMAPFGTMASPWPPAWKPSKSSIPPRITY